MAEVGRNSSLINRSTSRDYAGLQGLLQIEPAPLISGSAIALFFVCAFMIMSISMRKLFNFRRMINTAHM